MQVLGGGWFNEDREFASLARARIVSNGPLDSNTWHIAIINDSLFHDITGYFYIFCVPANQ